MPSRSAVLAGAGGVIALILFTSSPNGDKLAVPPHASLNGSRLEVPPTVATARAAEPRRHAPQPLLNPSSAVARQQRALFDVPPAGVVSPCGHDYGFAAPLPPLSAALVSQHSRRGVVFATIATSTGMDAMVVNFVGHLAPLVGACAVLVGWMGDSAVALPLSARIAAGGAVGSYAAGTVGASGNQAGRWQHARALLSAAAEARVELVLADADVVWLRDPWPYMQAVYAEGDAKGGGGIGGELDGLISTDSTGDWIKPLPAAPRLAALSAELALELPASTCGRSLNIGLLALRPQRAGAGALLDSAVRAVAAMGRKQVDQGAMNRAWKGRARTRYHGPASAGCALLNGTVRLGVLPHAQFSSLLGYSVRKLHTLRDVEPIAVHATFLRRQEPIGKMMRLREEGLWLDPPWHYGDGAAPPLVDDRFGGPAMGLGLGGPAMGLGHALGERGGGEARGGNASAPSSVRFLTYTPHVPAAALVQPPIVRGTVPAAHMALMRLQLLQLREALAIARVLGRALVLPRMRCSCELAFGPGYTQEACDAGSPIVLPYDCPIDHWLVPRRLKQLGWAHRERGFLQNSRVPAAVLDSSADARKCTAGPGARSAGCCLTTRTSASEAVLLAELGGCDAAVLELGDVRGLFGGFAQPATAAAFDGSFEWALSAWCCSTDANFKVMAGLVPYTLRDPVAPGAPAAGVTR